MNLSSCLEVKKIVKHYAKKCIVNELSFKVHQGEVVGLLGPNGAGKTTAFYITAGLIFPDAGEVLFQQKNVTSLPLHKRARLGMGYLAQEPSVFRHLTVEENILAILELLPLSKQERLQELEKLLAELHLEPIAKKKAYVLSGGERRRVEITRALVTKPTLLMLDEPFANVDPLSVRELKRLIQLLVKQKGISILITDHNARELLSFVDTCYLMQQGQLTFQGTPQELIHNQHVRHTYLGADFSL